jgi:hypothetical protein
MGESVGTGPQRAVLFIAVFPSNVSALGTEVSCCFYKSHTLG